MQIFLHISPDPWVAGRVQDILASKREQLASRGVLFPRSPGNKNHTRLFMAAASRVDTLRYHRGYALPEDQAKLRAEVALALKAEVEAAHPSALILSAHQFGSVLTETVDLEALKDMLAPLGGDIRIIAQVEAPSKMLARHYAQQIGEGRMRSLDLEAGPATKVKTGATWWDLARATHPESAPLTGIFPEVQGAPAFIDLKGLQAFWEGTFGEDTLQFHPIPDTLQEETATDTVRALFGLSEQIGKVRAAERPALPSAEWLARARHYNDLVLRLLSQGKHALPRQMWRRMLGDLAVGGDAFDAAMAGKVKSVFSNDLKEIAKSHDAVSSKDLAHSDRARAFKEPEFTGGFRASQYLLANMARIEQATREARRDARKQAARLKPKDPEKTATPKKGASSALPPLAQQNYEKLLTSSFAPHNRLGRVNEEELAAAYTPAPPRDLPKGSSGNVIVGCMKNEAPYIIEWVAYHRAMGVDNFLIYTNGCEDGTSEILDRLQELGVLQHRNNDNWKGNSPQQYALNQALEEPVIKNAEWIIHIDVDEFMNVRCGNGTLQDFFERVPNATNVAMTWRLFGHNDVHDLKDELVLEQFDTCAPKFCPKPHTVWGFKTMFRNIGAYEKISCHRPNKLKPGKVNDVHWVNGSGAPMDDVKENGWRNSKKSIGYDLLQLNHYALRSAESFLIKRQRGRALHVDRSIGLNYWIRMDWSDFKDITIKRNIPRLRAEYDRLMEDKTLRDLHDAGFAWHKAKAEELHGIAEFEELYQQALNLRLTETERVAYSLALDMES